MEKMKVNATKLVNNFTQRSIVCSCCIESEVRFSSMTNDADEKRICFYFSTGKYIWLKRQ